MMTAASKDILEETTQVGYDSNRIELIGPFSVAWNTTGIAAGFVAVPGAPTIPTGTDVIKAWAEVTTAWNSVTSDALSLGLSNPALDSHVTLATYDAKAAVGSTATALQEPTSTVQRSASAAASARLTAKVTSVGGSLSAGAAKIYALISTPAGDE